VLLARPSYAMYRFYAEVAGAKIVEVDYAPPALVFPYSDLLSSITPATRAILIANPNNPTGTAINLDRSNAFSRPRPTPPSSSTKPITNSSAPLRWA